MNPARDSILSIVKRIIQVFYPANRRKAHGVLVVIFLVSIIDVISFSAIVPVIYLINNPAPITNNPILFFIYSALGFEQINAFILFALVGLVLVFVVKNLLLLAATYYQNRFIYAIAFFLIDRQVSRVYGSDYLELKNTNSVQYLRAIATAPKEFAVKLLLPIMSMLNEVLVMLLIIGALLYYYPLVLFLLFVAIVPLSYLLLRQVKKRLALISAISGKMEVDSFRHALEGVNAYTDIKLFSKEAVFVREIKNNFSQLYRVNAETDLYQMIPRRVIEILVILTICVLYAITTFWLNIPTADLVLILLTFATAAYRMMPCVNEVLFNIIRIKTSEYILRELAMIPEPVHREALPELPFSDKIEWRHIRFRYDGNEVLRDMDLELHKGEFIVIMGESGIGKSTMGKIMTGFIRPDAGVYLVDGQEVRQFGQVKHLMGYVTQDFYLFDRSLLENIAVGESPETIDRERVAHAVSAANLTEFVRSLPNGLDYRIGETGTRLSGGQKQRIAIARALYKDAQVLVLDEITSSLDKENEKEILDTIYRLTKEERRTVVLISHHVSATGIFDKVYELRDGILHARNTAP